MTPNPFDLVSRLPFIGAGDDTLAEIDHARPAGIVLQSDDGPTVSPHVVSAARGRLWFPLSRYSGERELLREHREVSILMTSRDGGFVSVSGEAKILDPLRPTDGFDAIPEVAFSGMAALRYVGDHVESTISSVRSARPSIINALPPRVMVAVRPRRMLRLDRDGDVVRRRGRWSTLMPRPAHPERGPLLVLDDQPDWVTRLVASTGPAVVGWAGDDGLVAIPGEWYGAKLELHIPTGVVDLLATPTTAPVAIGIAPEGARAHVPGGERAVLQGVATVTEIGPDHTRVSVAVDRITT